MDAIYTGAKIAEARKAKGLTQKQMADQLGVTDKAVSKWERGLNYPDVALWGPLSALLDISLLNLICDEGAGPEQVVQIASTISQQERAELKCNLKWYYWYILLLPLGLIAAQIYISYALSQAGIYGLPQGLTLGLIPLSASLTGGAIYMLRHLKKL